MTEDRGKGETLVEITGKKKRKSMGLKKEGQEAEIEKKKRKSMGIKKRF